MGFQHRLLSVCSVLILHIAPGLPALHISQPPAAQVCGWLSLVWAPSPPQVPTESILMLDHLIIQYATGYLNVIIYFKVHASHYRVSENEIFTQSFSH